MRVLHRQQRTLLAAALSLVPIILGSAPLTTAGRARAAPRRLPALPTLWAPIDLARFLHRNKLEGAASAVMGSVRLGAFDEIDGPAFLNGEGNALASRLSVPLSTVVQLKAALRQAEQAAYEQRAGNGAAPASLRPAELGWGWASAREASAGSTRLEHPKLLADRIAGALWGVFIGDALAMPAHWYYDVDALRAGETLCVCVCVYVCVCVCVCVCHSPSSSPPLSLQTMARSPATWRRARLTRPITLCPTTGSRTSTVSAS